MKITQQLNESAVLAETGRRLAAHRLDLGWSQAELADRAGVSKRRVERIEAGASTQVANWIRVLRALELLDVLERLLPEPGPRPTDLLKLQRKQRRRATPKRGGGKSDWKWGEDR